MCLVAALLLTGRPVGDGSSYVDADRWLVDAVRAAGWKRLSEWNDAPHRTQADVDALLRTGVVVP